MTEIYLSTGVWPLTPWGWTASATGKPVCHFLSPPENQFLTSCSRLIPSPGPGLQAGTQYANIPRIISTVSVASPLIGWWLILCKWSWGSSAILNSFSLVLNGRPCNSVQRLTHSNAGLMSPILWTSFSWLLTLYQLRLCVLPPGIVEFRSKFLF